MPPSLQSLVTFFEALSESERRGALMDFADEVSKHAPGAEEQFDLDDVRKDTECSDSVGIHVRRLAGDRIGFAISLGCQVQTLTRALSTVLCRGLNGATREEILALEPSFIPRVVGEELTMLRSRTIYYVFARLKTAILALAE